MKVKTERLASLLLKEVNDILYNEIRDEDIIGVTATYIKLADDLSYAKIYCSVFDLSKKDKALHDLNNAEGYIKSILCKRKLPLRVIPELEFGTLFCNFCRKCGYILLLIEQSVS